MPLYDFACTKCGHTDRSVYYHVARLPRRRKCRECGKIAQEQVYDAPRRGLINFYAPGVGYGKVHPQTMEVMDSYATKRKWMKKWGWEEAADPDKGSRSWMEKFEPDQPEPTEDGGIGVMWGDDSESVRELAKQNRHAKDKPTLG